VKHRTLIYLGSATIAEFFADVMLTPLEATRIRLVSERGFATGLVSGFTRIAKEGGLRELYAGFLPILYRYRSQSVNSPLMNYVTNLYFATSPKKLNATYPKVDLCSLGFH